jgi:hypothetical protein
MKKDLNKKGGREIPRSLTLSRETILNLTNPSLKLALGGQASSYLPTDPLESREC